MANDRIDKEAQRKVEQDAVIAKESITATDYILEAPGAARQEDVSKYNAALRFGFNRVRNLKVQEEDALAWHILTPQELASLSPLEIGQRLWTTYRLLNNLNRDSFRDGSGTSAVTTVYDGRGHLITATVGDSVSFAVIYAKDGTPLRALQLNRVIYPDNPTEKRRIEASSGFVMGKRVANRYPVSRAIGYTDQWRHDVSGKASSGLLPLREDQVITAQPFIDVIPIGQMIEELGIDVATIGSIQIINTSHGFTMAAKEQSETGHQNYLLEILKTIPSPASKPEHELAKELTQAAKNTPQSKDNISVAIQTLTVEGASLKQIKISTPPWALCIADGDFDKGAASLVVRDVGKAFKQQMALTPSVYAGQALSAVTQAKSFLRDNAEVVRSFLPKPAVVEAVEPPPVKIIVPEDPVQVEKKRKALEKAEKRAREKAEQEAKAKAAQKAREQALKETRESAARKRQGKESASPSESERLAKGQAEKEALEKAQKAAAEEESKRKEQEAQVEQERLEKLAKETQANTSEPPVVQNPVQGSKGAEPTVPNKELQDFVQILIETLSGARDSSRVTHDVEKSGGKIDMLLDIKKWLNRATLMDERSKELILALVRDICGIKRYSFTWWTPHSLDEFEGLLSQEKYQSFKAADDSFDPKRLKEAFKNKNKGGQEKDWVEELVNTTKTAAIITKS